MEETVILALGVILVLVAGAWIFWKRQRQTSLVRKYGPEYERLVQERGDPRQAARELEARESRVRKFELQPLSMEARERYWSEWKRLQALFVDRPVDAVQEAHELLMKLMRDRGYPEAALEQRQKDLSVHYPDLMQAYREACDIAARSRGGREPIEVATTEDLRRAMVHYRSLFSALLDEASAGRRQKYEVAS